MYGRKRIGTCRGLNCAKKYDIDDLFVSFKEIKPPLRSKKRWEFPLYGVYQALMPGSRFASAFTLFK